MRSIYEIFKTLSEEKIHTVLSEFQIDIPEDYLFSNINIVIGKNGSGKTRFLNALKKLYKLSSINVVYGYFPEISFEKKSKTKNGDLPDNSLIDSIIDNEIEFEDFFKEIQTQNGTFFNELMTASSNRQKRRNDLIFKSIEETFFRLTGYEIKQDGKDIILSQNGKDEALKTVLKRLSPGELILFYFSIFISLQTGKKKVIIMDEPEGHLHTQAILEFLRLLKQTECFSDLWIASHSLFTIPEFEFENIVYIENGAIINRNSILYQKMLENMIGENYLSINRFFTSLEQWAYSEFIDECFEEPAVIDTVNPKDEQVELFVEFLKSKPSLKVLDFGAGKARLGRSYFRGENSKITYEVYDPERKDQTYGFKFFDSPRNIPSRHYECVVLMNVLHEIEPTSWRSVFTTIRRVLKDDGYLLFVETSVLNKGEMPTKTGFIVLGKEELQKLFGNSEGVFEIKIKDNQKSVCYAVPRNNLTGITLDTVFDTIGLLKENTYSNLKKERKTGGRRYAFYTQLYINASLFLEKEPLLYSKKKDGKNISVREYNTLMNAINTYLNDKNKAGFYEFMLINRLQSLINESNLSKEEKDYLIVSILDDIEVCKQIANARQLIAVALLTLLMKDNSVAKKDFIQNNYEQYLPQNIQRLRRIYVSFLRD